MGAAGTGVGHPYVELRLADSDGLVEALDYVAAQATRGLVWVGGVGGGWDSPARDLYPRLAASLAGVGIRSAHVRFRAPGDLSACTADTLAGVH